MTSVSQKRASPRDGDQERTSPVTATRLLGLLLACWVGTSCGGPDSSGCGSNVILGCLPTQPAVPCTSVSWIVSIRSDTNLAANPPVVRVKVGQLVPVQAWPVNLRPAGCHGPSFKDDAAFTSADPSVATIERIGPVSAPSAQVRGVARGDTTVFVPGLPGTADPTRAELAACRSPYEDCTPVYLILRVVR